MKGGKSEHFLREKARLANLVWNYCNETSYKAIRTRRKWLSKFDFSTLLKGGHKELGLSITACREVAYQYVVNRDTHKKAKLSWRVSSRQSSKYSLGWVPCGAGAVLRGKSVVFMKRSVPLWLHRKPEGRLKTVTFSEDARGRWYASLVCEVDESTKPHGDRVVGVDLGLKTQATCSDGFKYERENLTRRYEEMLAVTQRARRKGRTRAIHAKIKNIRRDWTHKTSHHLVSTSSTIVVGDIDSSALSKTNMAKSVYDAGWYDLKMKLGYKAKRHGVRLKFVNEAYTTQACSACGLRIGPSGVQNLNVRIWSCSCGAQHDRDVNAARNILARGLGQDIDLLTGTG